MQQDIPGLIKFLNPIGNYILTSSACSPFSIPTTVHTQLMHTRTHTHSHIYTLTHTHSHNSGKFGVVYRCHDKKTGSEAAVKIMQKKGNKQADVEREVEVLRKLDHPAILKIYDYFEVATDFVLSTEL